MPNSQSKSATSPTRIPTPPEYHLLDENLEKSLQKDKQYLETTALPIVTVSATYQEDLKGLHHLPENDTTHDIVFSRAHYSMALGLAMQEWTTTIDPKKAWFVDPTNYVNAKNWRSITLTETIGKILARHKSLKSLKDLVDKFGRQKLPILASITPPLLYLTENIHRPILSLHIATGNILALKGKEVIQVITDPHVREDYLANAHLPNMKFCVFDRKTKTEFLEKATILGIDVDPSRVFITGPPIDPRIINARVGKKPHGNVQKPIKPQRALRLCITTGGLGTNKDEIKKALKQLLPELRKRQPRYHLMVNAATHSDIRDMVLDMAKEERVSIHTLSPRDPAHFAIAARTAGTFLDNTHSPGNNNAKLPQKHATMVHKLTLLYHPQIVDSNELLIQHAFPWADGFITKPSGDMAYDAVAAGCFLLTLDEWGEWEHNIRETFEQLNIARKADINHLALQLESLTATHKGIDFSWVNNAMKHAQEIDPLFLSGARDINKVAKRK